MVAGAAYTFGDVPDAAARLARLDGVFGGATAALLDAVPSLSGPRVQDLGCGPGHTTAALVTRYPAATVEGIDTSAAFLTEARRRVPSATFRRADVADRSGAGPLGPPAHLLHARFLLAHLPDPAGVLDAWFAHLTPGGALASTETEEIDTADPDFTEYLALVTALIASRGATMRVGAQVHEWVASRAPRVITDHVAEVTVPASDTAALFTANLATVRRDPFVRARYADAALDDLMARLAAHLGPSEALPVVWRLRQVVAVAAL